MSSVNGQSAGAPVPGLVSVIVIFLDEERFLAEALASVVAQTYPHWELLLVDDGSTDGSTALARQHVVRDPARVRYLEHPGHANRGMSAARNAGLRAARGEYVAFLDADDALVPRALEEQVTLLSAHPAAAMVYGPSEWWYSWTGEPVDAARDVLQPMGVRPDRLVDPPALVSAFLRHEGRNPTGPLLRRTALDAVGGFDERFRGMYEDQVLRVKICLWAPVFVSSRRWYRYRQHPGSHCAQAVRSGEHRRMRHRFLTWAAAYVRAQGIRDQRLQRALRRALWQCRYPILFRLARHVRQVVSRARGTHVLRTLHGAARSGRK